MRTLHSPHTTAAQNEARTSNSQRGSAWELEVAHGDDQVAGLGDGERVLDGRVVFGEEAVHLVRRLQVELLGGEPPSVGVRDLGAGLQAQEHLVGAGVRRLEVVRVIGASDPHPEGPSDPDRALRHPDLVGQAVRLDLHEVVVRAEHLPVPAGHLLRPGGVAVIDYHVRGMSPAFPWGAWLASWLPEARPSAMRGDVPEQLARRHRAHAAALTAAFPCGAASATNGPGHARTATERIRKPDACRVIV